MKLLERPRPEQHYHQEGGRYLIEVSLGSVNQLYNSLDPSPFIEKDLDDDAARYIVESAGDFQVRAPLKLLILVPPGEEAEARQSVADAIHRYFGYMALLARRELRFTLRQGRLALVIGLTFLFGCITARELMTQLSWGPWAPILSEGLIIMGWVAMWRPLQIFLYDWWPIRRRMRVLEKLGRIEVEVRSAPAKTGH